MSVHPDRDKLLPIELNHRLISFIDLHQESLPIGMIDHDHLLHLLRSNRIAALR